MEAANCPLSFVARSALNVGIRRYNTSVFRSPDVTVAGAGVFGAWIAYHLTKRGARVRLVDLHGAANARASSGGETRILRMSYGADEIYTRSMMASMPQWKQV